MSEEYEIIFITEEGRAIKNNKTGKIYHSEFEIIDEKNKQIKDLQQKVEQLEKKNKELNRMCELYSKSLYNADLTKAEQKVEQLENIRKEAIKYVQEKADYPISYYHCLNDLLNILNKGSEE